MFFKIFKRGIKKELYFLKTSQKVGVSIAINQKIAYHSNITQK
jgi:hypothetical protein